LKNLTTAPAQITASLDARVHCILAHVILEGDRAYVDEPDPEDDAIHFSAELDREKGEAKLVDFPPIKDAVRTDLGRIKAEVRVEKAETGTYDAETGHVTVAVRLAFDPDHFLARTSEVELTLSSDAAWDEPEYHAVGKPLTLEDGTIVLVGEGTFDGGSLDGGKLYLAIECEVMEIG
jgi:hypothetical protein